MAEIVQGEVGEQVGWPSQVASQIVENMASQAIAHTLPGSAKRSEDFTAEKCTVKECAASGCLAEGRYFFNRQWACSHGCLEQLLRVAVVEEQTLAIKAIPKMQRHVRLGRILIGQGTINEAQLKRALCSQRATGAGRLGCWLKQQIELPEIAFTAALSIQSRCPVVHIGMFMPRPMVHYLPRLLVEERGALPLRVSGLPQRFFLCFEDRLDYQLIRATERMHGVAVDAGLLTVSEFWQGTRDLLSVPFPAATTVEASSVDGMIQAISQLLLDFRVREARLVLVHGYFWLRFWISQKAAGSVKDLLPHERLYERPNDKPYDILCRLRVTHGGLTPLEEIEDAEALTRQMLRVLG